MSSAEAAPTQPAASGSPVMTHRMILFVIFGLMAGMFLSALDQTVVGTAIRTIGDDLHGLSLQAWVTTAYLIVSTIATPIYGKLSDIFGRRPLFLFAIVVFIVGSILASFSTSMIELAVFRAVQGLGAGGLMSMPLAIMGDILAPRERAKYQGYFLAVFGISSVVGPLVGGLFAGTDSILWITGWRWVFLINVPIGLIALGMVLRFLHLPKMHGRGVRIDWWGAAAVIIALVPLLLVAEEGQNWGWDSLGAIACYVIGAIGAIAFIIIEMRMKDDALIPMKLFRNSTFSMATLIGVLVGFGMFGAMMTIPLYLQIVLGSTPTESGYQMLPMILGLMIASIASGQLIARNGRYRIFPILGTGLLSGGFLYLTFLKYDSSYWFIAGAMLLIGLGLGQLMQTLTIASQNSVGLRDMGVATSASTFFRQIGGTLGTAVLVSLLFTVMPGNIQGSLSDSGTLKSALNAALTPSVASAPENKKIMDMIYTPLTDALKKGTTEQVAAGVSKATAAAKAAVAAEVAAGKIPASAQATGETQAVQQALTSLNGNLAKQGSVASVSSNGTVTLDFSNDAKRSAFVDQVEPSVQKKLKGSKLSGGSSAINDTSFLNDADKRLSKPFLVGFDASAVQIYWVALLVVLLAFVLTWFFKTPPLRAKSALQEAADDQALLAKQAADEDEAVLAKLAADRMGALIEANIDTSGVPVQTVAPNSAPSSAGGAPSAAGSAPSAAGKAPSAASNAPSSAGNAPSSAGNAPRGDAAPPRGRHAAPEA